MGEKDPSNPTRSPRELVGKIAHGAKEGLIIMGYALVPGGGFAYGIRRAGLKAERAQPKPQVERPTPTQASDSFLKYCLTQELGPILNNATKFPAAIVTEFASWQLIEKLGGFNIHSDIAEGNWGRAATKGILMGIMATPFVRLARTH